MFTIRDTLLLLGSKATSFHPNRISFGDEAYISRSVVTLANKIVTCGTEKPLEMVVKSLCCIRKELLFDSFYATEMSYFPKMVLKVMLL